MSPQKKKAKIETKESIKRSSEASDLCESSSKRLKPVSSKDEGIQARKRKNFITACEQVSFRDYFDHQARLLLVYLPSCMKTLCKHDKNEECIKQMPLFAQELFETEMKSNMWYDALEVCVMSITPTQYLPSDVLKNVVEIIMNAHEDEYSDYTVDHLIDRCQQILMQSFSTHPPCVIKGIRNCYKNFLTSPMVLKEDTFTDRNRYECHKGIIKYCFNRLEYEISIESEDGPLVDKDVNIPEEMKNSVRGLHWQKEKCEIFELLNRHDRIERLFAVLEVVIELLQFDLAIWHSRYTNDLGRHIMRSHKPLMAYVLWSENVLYTGAVTNICRQILRIFTKIIHLNYPTTKVRIITIWLNTMIQTFYICEANSNMDYPNTSKYCTVFANDFYKIISEFPHDSIIRILERIEPSFMRHLIGHIHLSKILPTTESCIIRLFINFITDEQWKLYQCSSKEIIISDKLFPRPKKCKKKISYLMKILLNEKCSENTMTPVYEKMEDCIEKMTDICQNHVVHSLYITFEAYLDAYDLQSVQETWSDLNEKSLNGNLTDESISYIHSCYSVTDSLIKKYRNSLQSIKELLGILNDLKSKGELPEIFNVFGNIGLLEL